MKGLILCGGRGTRLKPITDYIPKQLLPIANKPLIFYTIELLIKSGVDNIGIVVNEENKGIFKKILSSYFNIDFHYIVQKDPKGIAHGLLEAENFVGNEKFTMILGDNSFQLDLKNYIDDFKNSNSNCRILLKEVDNPEKFGVAYIGDNKIINLDEKPKNAFSNLAITGIYNFDSSIFKACKEIQPSKRGELEITDAIKWLLQNSYYVDYEILDGYWKDVGSHQDVIEENLHRLTFIEEDIKGEIVNSQFGGKIILEENAVLVNSIVRGPIIIGENSIVKNSYIGPYTSIGKDVNISNSNIENSIILDNCTIDGVKTPIDYSIIGQGSIISNINGLKKVNSFILGKNSKVYL